MTEQYNKVPGENMRPKPGVAVEEEGSNLRNVGATQLERLLMGKWSLFPLFVFLLTWAWRRQDRRIKGSKLEGSVGYKRSFGKERER